MRCVQQCYEAMNGRKLACKRDEAQTLRMKRFLRSIKTKCAPARLRIKTPATVEDRKRIHNVMDVENNPLDLVFFTIFLTMFQGVCRTDDLCQDNQVFNRATGVARSYVVAGKFCDEQGQFIALKLTLRLNVTKTTSQRMPQTEKPLIFDDTEGTLSATVFIAKMMGTDPTNDPENTPLFRNLHTKLPITKQQVYTIFKGVVSAAKLNKTSHRTRYVMEAHPPSWLQNQAALY